MGPKSLDPVHNRENLRVIYRSNLDAGVRREIGYMSQVREWILPNQETSGKKLSAENEERAKGKKKIEMGLGPVASRAADSCSAQKNAGKNPGTSSHIFF